MKRENLKVFTKISFLIALTSITILPISLYMLAMTSNENIVSILKVFISVTFFASLFAVPLSVISMLSKENLTKRIFVLLGNLLPIGLLTYAIILEFVDEFLQTTP
ncbi:2-acyl-glycerophospho-ethanolamine acyltransferase [Bacillus wiedmannii]|uniref:2-acyl-glycerophospho-ethanolamine acyltransferase n=1 Tax=Bacillus wiedmannii TaxID=1890302 RepID=UPI0021D2384D|nr:2-acyl-glycerophospho-ethanolamine acyltransferase [Bacillus wiedmannii]MCU5331531.1 2-acyl-glycerophospho-ethanolamine acyltransferase [Bacillus wiedmannii]